MNQRRLSTSSPSVAGNDAVELIQTRFRELFPEVRHGDLARRIGRYWVDRLRAVREAHGEKRRKQDAGYDPADPLSRIRSAVVVIAYADSVFREGSPTLETLDDFLAFRFPAVKGLHLLPACEMAENRFNDGGFSQIRRDRIHSRFGSNARFAALMGKYVSMTDLVLNHVDVDHPVFRRYLDGDDDAGRCFYVFTEAEYRERKQRGDFEAVFRPRPFPLFTLFRRVPRGEGAHLTHGRRLAAMNRRFQERGLAAMPETVVDFCTVFDKVVNDQMLLDEDVGRVERFRQCLAKTDASLNEALFSLSRTQETQHDPWVFADPGMTLERLLALVLPLFEIGPDRAAGNYASVFRAGEADLFGESIRALTTFSHVQVDLNTATYEGLRLLADDLAWYLSMDMNMLRLDAANFAFKKWGTSCFGLPEVGRLMEILYLSMDWAAPRMVPNLEVNAPLKTVLAQMADKDSPPPMIYDFHLACMLPSVFNQQDIRPLEGIAPLVDRYVIPRHCIRFSLDESHDGKSVSGSGGPEGLLSYGQRSALMRVVTDNGGRVKFKAASPRCIDAAELAGICRESGLDFQAALAAAFDGAAPCNLKAGIQNTQDLALALGVDPERMASNPALKFLADKLFRGREPYELCVSTRDALARLDDAVLEVRRYIALKTLGLALMGRHVKAVYFNDLMGLPNDPERMNRSGELRDIKRTRSDRDRLDALLDDPRRCEYWIARLMNNTIALVDRDPALSPRGGEARVSRPPGRNDVALVENTHGGHVSLAVVNVSDRSQEFDIDPSRFGFGGAAVLFDNISKTRFAPSSPAGPWVLRLAPYDRLWITREPIAVPSRSQTPLPPLPASGPLPG